MGCDIHLYVEVKKEKWEPAGKTVINRYHDDFEYDENFFPSYLKQPIEVPSESGFVGKFVRERFYTAGRNYGLFGILAGVRWYSAKAIAKPKGIPKDASAAYREVVEKYGSDGHSHSHFTVKELLEFDWTQSVDTFVCLNLRDFYHWITDEKLAGEFPTKYQDYYGSGNLTKDKCYISEDQALGILEGFEKEASGDYKKFRQLIETYGRNEEAYAQYKHHIDDGLLYMQHVAVQVQMPMYKIAEAFWQETMPRLLALGKPANVRIMFFFDN